MEQEELEYLMDYMRLTNLIAEALTDRRIKRALTDIICDAFTEALVDVEMAKERNEVVKMAKQFLKEKQAELAEQGVIFSEKPDTQ